MGTKIDDCLSAGIPSVWSNTVKNKQTQKWSPPAGATAPSFATNIFLPKWILFMPSRFMLILAMASCITLPWHTTTTVHPGFVHKGRDPSASGSLPMYTLLWSYWGRVLASSVEEEHDALILYGSETIYRSLNFFFHCLGYLLEFARVIFARVSFCNT